MRTLHGLLDVNNDGVISYEDFKLLADSFAALGHLNAEEQKEFNEVLRRTWETQWGEPTPYNLVNVEQYLNEMHHAINDHELRDKIHHFLPFLFKVSERGSELRTLILKTVLSLLLIRRQSTKTVPASFR